MNPNIVATVYKTVAEVFSRSIDFSNWMASGDSISSHDVGCYQGTTDYTSTMIGTTSDDSDSTVTVELKAGTAGEQYLVVVEATTTQGDVWVALITLIVNEGEIL